VASNGRREKVSILQTLFCVLQVVPWERSMFRTFRFLENLKLVTEIDKIMLHFNLLPYVFIGSEI